MTVLLTMRFQTIGSELANAVILRSESSKNNQPTMLRNYLKIAYRSLLRHKLFSMINISGLAIGMAASLLILQYGSFELSYDNFHENADDVYRIAVSEGTLGSPMVPPPLGPGLKENLPEVRNFTRLILPWSGQAATSTLAWQHPDEGPVMQTFQWGFYGDPGFLEVFSFPWIEGDRKNALRGANKIVLTESTARKLFGNDLSGGDVLGRELEYTNEYDRFQFVVTGINADAPANSHFQFDFIASFATLSTGWGKGYAEEWHGNGTYTYLELAPGTDVNLFDQKLNEYVRSHGQQNQYLNKDYLLQPLKKIHLHSRLGNELKVNGNATYVSMLLIMATLILLVALVNYINLVTARSVSRGSETGIRKVMGAIRPQLIRQFMLESFLLNVLAYLLAIILFYAASPLYSGLTGRPLVVDNGIFWWFIVLVFPLSSILSGLYPAFVMSGYDPLLVLKGRLVYSTRGKLLRMGTVVFQFLVSIGLIIFTFTVSQQLRYMRAQDPGFDREAVVVVRGPLNRMETWIEHGKKKEKGGSHDVFKESVLGYAGVKSVSHSWSVPGERASIWNTELGETYGNRSLNTLKTDNDYAEVYGLEVLAGRFDTNNGVVINETTAEILGFKTPQSAIGETFSNKDGYEFKINGVIRDYHHQSLQYKIAPLIFVRDDLSYKLDSYYSINVDTRRLETLVRQIESTYRKVYPQNLFTYYFISDYFDAQYREDQRLQRLFSIFSALTIFIAGLGLFGLSMHSVIEKTKEIGIRKVLGASVLAIVGLVTIVNLKLVLFACIVAIPLAYWGTELWLSSYAARIEQEWWLFTIPVLAVFLMVLLAVSFHTIKAALLNPAEAIRNE